MFCFIHSGLLKGFWDILPIVYVVPYLPLWSVAPSLRGQVIQASTLRIDGKDHFQGASQTHWGQGRPYLQSYLFKKPAASVGSLMTSVSMGQGVFVSPEGRGENWAGTKYPGCSLLGHACCFKDCWGSVPELPWDIIVLLVELLIRESLRGQGRGEWLYLKTRLCECQLQSCAHETGIQYHYPFFHSVIIISGPF